MSEEKEAVSPDRQSDGRDTYRFVKEEDGRVFQQQSRDCHSLLLAS